MFSRLWQHDGRWGHNASTALIGVVLAACGGGNLQDSGTNKTYLSVAATDADGDTLQYQWRVTAGSIENRNAPQAVWTMPDGPGLHFAYVVVSDGKGGYSEQQYAVSSDALETSAPARSAVSHPARSMQDFAGATVRLRFISPGDPNFTPPTGGAAVARLVYLPDMQVQLVKNTGANPLGTVFSGLSDLSGEVNLPKLESTANYTVMCATAADSPLADCGSFTARSNASVRTFAPALTAARNLRLFGHVGFADGGVCGAQNEFFGLQSAATVQLQQADGQVLSAAVRINRFGDYAIDAAVPVNGKFKLALSCEAYQQLLDVPASPDAAGYTSAAPVELSYQIPNSRPQIVKVVANGPEGNVRGRMLVAEPGAVSNSLPGPDHFLTFKGKDTKLGACMYYRALSAVKDCDAQGGMIEPISLDDWKRQHKLAPYGNGNVEVAANYINKMDLNLVRRMVATTTGPQDAAFVVCNSPGPEGSSQQEVDEVLAIGLADERRVACVAMEWSVTPGVNGDKPFTKFLTFGPDGALIPSVNLDGRGEKYMPGACVACHGGTQYNGRFPEKGNPSPYLGSSFLPFDTGNYLFGSSRPLTEAAQSTSFHDLNMLVLQTEGLAAGAPPTAVSNLMAGWYAPGSNTLDKTYVPKVWADEEANTPGAQRFYREIVGSSCRTCHVSRGLPDWDSTVLSPLLASTHVCGGKADIAINATMPNALISRDRVTDRVRADPTLAALMTTFLGCDTPLPDPVYPSR